MFREQGFLFLLLTRSDLRARRLFTAARESLTSEDRAVVAHRYSTEPRMRPYVVPLGAEEFRVREDFGCFSFNWTARDAEHAVGIEVDRWMDGGLNVLVHAHRRALEPALQRYGARLRIIIAPIPNGQANWRDVLDEWRRRNDQLPLALSVDEEPIEGMGETALVLSAELERAQRELVDVVRQQTPPLGEDLPQPRSLSLTGNVYA